jgi:hypothetical protein
MAAPWVATLAFASLMLSICAASEAPLDAERHLRPFGAGNLEEGEQIVTGVAVSYIADYFKEGRAQEFTVVTDSNANRFVFSDLPEGEHYAGHTVRWHTQVKFASRAHSSIGPLRYARVPALRRVGSSPVTSCFQSVVLM